MAFSVVESLQATNTASPAVTTSAGVLTTDVILFVHAVSTTTAVPTKPGTVTELTGLTANTTGTVCQTRLYWVVAAPSTTYTFGRDTAGRNTLTAVVLRGLDTTTPFGAKDQVSRSVAELHTSPTINTTTGGDLLVGVWSARVFPTNNWTLDTSGYTEHIDAVGADGSTNCRIMVASNDTAAATAGSYSATAHLNAADGEPALIALLEANPAASGGQSVAAGTATETDAAQPVGRAKSRTVSLGAETDTAVAAGQGKARTAGVAVDTSTAGTATTAKAHTAATAASTDTALPLGHARAYTVTAATEADTATTVAGVKASAVSPAADTSTAQPAGWAKARLLGAAGETSTALPVSSGGPIILVGTAEDTSTATGLVHGKARLVGVAVETSTAQPAGRAKTRTLSAAAETGTAGTVTSAKLRVVTAAADISTATPVTWAKRRLVTAATETDTARPISQPGAASTPAVGTVTAVRPATTAAVRLRTYGGSVTLR